MVAAVPLAHASGRACQRVRPLGIGHDRQPAVVVGFGAAQDPGADHGVDADEASDRAQVFGQRFTRPTLHSRLADGVQLGRVGYIALVDGDHRGGVGDVGQLPGGRPGAPSPERPQRLERLASNHDLVAQRADGVELAGGRIGPTVVVEVGDNDRATWARTSATCSSAMTRRRCTTARSPPPGRSSRTRPPCPSTPRPSHDLVRGRCSYPTTTPGCGRSWAYAPRGPLEDDAKVVGGHGLLLQRLLQYESPQARGRAAMVTPSR